MISSVVHAFHWVGRSLRRHPLYRWGLLALSLGLAPAAGAQPGGIEARPLAGRSAPAGPTMFTALAPEQTGLVTANAYGDPRMWNELYHEFEIGAIGCGVAIGDVDQDGRPDVFVVSKIESARLFRNLGGFKFEDVTVRAGVGDPGEASGAWKQGAAMADINNDGWLDIYVCRFGAPNLLYVNQGDGTFKEAAAAHGLAVSDATTMAAFCDYDRDGWLDVYLLTNLLDNSRSPGGQRDYLFRNNGDGTFRNVTDAAGMSRLETQGNSATWWDYDHDGWPDLYVANDFAVPDFLYRNNRDGTFTNVIDQVVPHTTYSSMGADQGDLNNDGRIDFLVADMAASTHQKDQRTMADTRARTRDPRDDDPAAPNYLRNALYLNTGTGRMQEAAHLTGLAATDWTWSVRFEDLDNDGRLDVHITNGMHREIHNTDLLTKMMTAESAVERIRIARSGPVLKEANLAYRNLGDLRFEPVAAAWGLDQRGVSFGTAFGDLDGDGDLDLVYTNFEAGPTVLRNDAPDGHRLVLGLRGTTSNRLGVGATVRVESAAGGQVRQLVLARGYMSTSEPVVHFGLGADAVAKRVEVTWPSGHRQVFENLAADQRYTLTEPAGAAPRMEPAAPPVAQFAEVSRASNLAWTAREDSIDEIAQQRLLPLRFNRRGPALAVGDVNGDGQDDILMGGTTRDETRILFGTAAGPYAELKLPPTLTGGTVNDGPVLIFDADGDGRNDLLITKGGNSQPAGAADYQPRLLMNSGSGLQPAGPGVMPTLSMSAGAAGAADFDRDGRPDLFLGARLVPNQYPDTPRSVLLANRAGGFVDVTAELAPGLGEVGLVTAALWSDVDGDEWPDLLLTLEWGHVKYFHNRQGRGLEDRTEAAGFAAAGTGWWQSLAAADFNGDGRPDFVAGNVGLNTPYHASAEAPTLLYNGVFREGSGPLLIEAYYEGGKVYPRRTRRDLGAAIPSILQRYPRNDFYARATLGEIVGEPKLAQAQRFAATELRSGVFLSQPDGRYRFEALPRVAQLAPLTASVTGDFDRDGHADLYAVQNSHAPTPVVGRFDGGLSQLLRGDGRGGFQAVAPVESGLVVPGEAKAVVVLDLDRDGWPDFLVSRNHGSTLAFRNQGRK
ncbi:FG-GAP repeat protein [Lacunisphaera limnophila]|uniref:FG-GAP repeat protein n=1 Tax=Lacunisphaera limnophila TaxID=1838286 RepID=A0A1D8ARQ7_9BACT|nr:VCBS repeat-containing protein [Lacunisphaera limnophila]AOS43562.1 FG-GAP repeat protein [Lacunisphaera limnophila]